MFYRLGHDIIRTESGLVYIETNTNPSIPTLLRYSRQGDDSMLFAEYDLIAAQESPIVVDSQNCYRYSYYGEPLMLPSLSNYLSELGVPHLNISGDIKPKKSLLRRVTGLRATTLNDKFSERTGTVELDPHFPYCVVTSGRNLFKFPHLHGLYEVLCTLDDKYSAYKALESIKQPVTVEQKGIPTKDDIFRAFDILGERIIVKPSKSSLGKLVFVFEDDDLLDLYLAKLEYEATHLTESERSISDPSEWVMQEYCMPEIIEVDEQEHFHKYRIVSVGGEFAWGLMTLTPVKRDDTGKILFNECAVVNMYSQGATVVPLPAHEVGNLVNFSKEIETMIFKNPKYIPGLK